MDSSLLTVILLIVFVYMMIKCGKGMTGKSGGCCGSGKTSNKTTNFYNLESKLDKLEKENESLKNKINEMKG
ncbi:hypothetical protein [Evansella cellulosilytica]|uniref:Uncharacterized protein n=1 Tax=Evansella cellulosilytica (strain ATCC 21833 / DSM 2522 / FERM P-1141 / JCM 9156 / N-4) TaxID=649639 RepID=E6TYY0_EVAC2|nr:hypothetical protein [Evansella cellulosilytica]ADU31315.1 hypothetical protein Bcell_3070 [Evansella cellulosilytica DSM 2522]